MASHGMPCIGDGERYAVHSRIISQGPCRVGMYGHGKPGEGAEKSSESDRPRHGCGNKDSYSGGPDSYLEIRQMNYIEIHSKRFICSPLSEEAGSFPAEIINDAEGEDSYGRVR